MEHAVTVDLIASGYDWICPECDSENREIEMTQTITCPECDAIFWTGEYRDAY